MRAIMLVVGAMSVICGGCSTLDVMVQKQGETEKRLESLAQSGVLRDQRVSDLETSMSQLQRTVRQNSDELESLRTTVAHLRASLDKGEQPAGAVSKIEVVNRETSDREPGPPSDYVKAFGLFSANSYTEAISAFEAFLRSNPDGEYAANSHFWIGECHYAQQDFSKAVISFQRVLEQYPASAKIPDSMFRIGTSLSILHEPAKARQMMEQLVQRYPQTPAAVKAREWLARQ